MTQPAGGQFALGGGRVTGKGPAPKKGPHRPAHPGGLGFDGKHGTGYGHKGGDASVRDVQRALNHFGFTDDQGKPLAVDGKFGPKTTAAVKKLQRKMGLEPTGKVDDAFVARLNDAMPKPNTPAPHATPHHKTPAKRPTKTPPKPAPRPAKAAPMQHGPLRPGGAVARARTEPVSERSIPDDFEEGRTVAAVERRFTLVPVELRAGGDTPKIGGYAAVFNKFSRNLGGFVETVNPAFFNKSRGDGWPDVMARHNHDDNMLLGTTAAGTLLVQIDGVGLDYEVNPPRSRGDVVELVQRRDIRKSSFAFRLGSGGDDWGLSEQGYPQRILVSGALIDVATVNSPAYNDSTAGLRSMSPDLAADASRLGLGPDAAYASLAYRMDADVEEVRALADEDELRRFFIRTDGPSYVKPKPRLLGAAAAVALMARRSDPWG